MRIKCVTSALFVAFKQSARGAQPSQSDRDEPADRGLGRQAAGCCEGVEAVARKLVRRDIIPEVAGLCDLGQQVSDQVDELLLRPGDGLPSMQECREFGAVVLAVVGDERVGLEHRFEPLASVAGLVPEFGEMCGIIALVVVPLFVILMFTRGPGGHGPGRHTPDGHTPPAGQQGGHTPPSSQQP